VTVHVGEIASEVASAAPGAPLASDRGEAPPAGISDGEWADRGRRARWLADRIRAEGFDD